MEKKKFSILISSAFYEVRAYSPYVTSLVNSIRLLNQAGLNWSYQQISGDSYVDRAKNALVHEFLKSNHTHIMIIDSDEAWDVSGFGRLVKAAMIPGCEMVCGLYPCKNMWDFFGGIEKRSEDGYVMGKEIHGSRLIEMEVAPGGFVIYSREAFERTRPNLDSYVDPQSKEEILEAFKCSIETEHKHMPKDKIEGFSHDELVALVMRLQSGGKVGGNRIGEDVYFQQRFKEMGGAIWCEPNIEIEHYGIKAWKGNFQDHLLAASAKAAIEASVGATEEDTERMLSEMSNNLQKVKDINAKFEKGA